MLVCPPARRAVTTLRRLAARVRQAAAGRLPVAGAWLVVMHVSCQPGAATGQTCGAAGGDNRPATAQPCPGDTASHPADGPATGTANSIDLVTGNKYLRERDAAWPGGLVLDRHYNSRNPFPRTLGTGWTHGYDTVLVRIERSGPPERPFDQQPAQLTGGMGGPSASRAERSRADAGTASGSPASDPASPAAGTSAARGRADARTDAELPVGGRRRRGAAAVELQIIQADGRRLVFRAVREPGTPHGVVRYRAVSGDYGAISEQPGHAADRYQWRWRDGRRIGFDADGRMRRIDPPEGRPLVLDYRPDGRLDTVRAAGGLALHFEYTDSPDHAGSLRAVRLPDGQRVRYEHDALGLLVRATDAIGDERRYRYDDPHQPHALTEVRDATDVVRGRFAYDAGGRAIASALGAGAQAIRVRYTLPAAPGDVGESVVTDVRDRESRYRWRYDVHLHRAQWLSASGEGCEACPPVGLSYGYDGQGRLVSAQSPQDGAGLRWRRDARGRVVEVLRIDAAAARSAPAAAGSGPSPAARIPPPALLARFGYAGDDPDAPPVHVERPSVAPGRWYRLAWTRDGEGRIVAVRETGWTPVPASMDADLRAERFAPLSREWRIERDTDGQLMAVDGPLPGPDDRLRYERDAAGRLLRVRRPAGLETRYERDRWGRIVATVDQDGIAQRWTRGADGRPLSLEIDGAMLRVGWGADPRQVTVDSPATGPMVLRFDEADRLREVEDALGRRLRVARDAQDVVTRYDVRDAAGVQLLALDPAAALSGPPAPSAPPTQPASHGRTTWREAGGRGIAAHDDFGRVVATANPQGLRTLQAWDAADRMVAAVRSDGRAVRQRHDAAGRLIESGLPGRADLVRYRWLGGRLASVSDPWQTVAWQYDRHGRVIAEATLIGPREDGVDRLVTVVREWHYDTRGRLAGETLPGGHRLDYRYGVDGRLIAVSFTDTRGRYQSLMHNITWLPFGPSDRGMTGWRTGNGLSTSVGYDLQGRVASLRYVRTDGSSGSSLPPVFLVQRDALGRTVRIDRDSEPTAIVRDATGRVTGVASGTFAEGYAWDNDGNRLARVRRIGSEWEVQRQRFSSNGRLVAVEQSPARSAPPIQHRSVEHSGQLLHAGTHLLPNAQGRPVAIVDHLGRGMVAAYNSFGQRVVSQEAGGHDGPVLQLHYAGRRQAVLDRRGELRQWNIRVGDRLVAILVLNKTQATVWSVHGDINGRPIAVSDSEGGVYRMPERTPFGEEIAFDTRDPILQRVSIGRATPSMPELYARLPGDLLDGELRDFDPGSGRWLQPDPLGVAAGLNLHALVGGDPIDRIDPSGLYQTDVHFYVTFFLARVAGLPYRQALTIANAAQFVDDNPETHPIPNYTQFFTQSLRVHIDRLAAYHFTHAQADPPRLPNESDQAYALRRMRNPSNEGLNALLARANNASSPCERSLLFGNYVHAFQDAFAHRDASNAPIPIGVLGVGHLFDDVSPDRTFNHVGPGLVAWRLNEVRTLEMQRELFEVFKKNFGLESASSDGFPIEFVDVERALSRFNAVREEGCENKLPCWTQKRALLAIELDRLGLGPLPTYDRDAAAEQRRQILGKP